MDLHAAQCPLVIAPYAGCYIHPADDVPPALWNIGIRIEDDVAITAQCNEVLTDAAPKTVANIEELMRQQLIQAKLWGYGNKLVN